METLKSLIRNLIKLFKNGGRLRNGRNVPRNIVKANRMSEFNSLLQNEGEQVVQGYKTLDKTTRVQYLRDLKNGKISAKRLIAKLKARAVTPIGYNLTKPFAIPLEILLPKIGPKYQSLRNRYDAWYIYNGAPQKYNSMIKIGKGADGLDVYSIKNFTISKNDIDAIIRNPKEKDILTTFNFGGVHGNGGASKGVDAKGKYIIFYDHWDLQPLKGVVNRLGKKLKLSKKQTDKIAEWEVGGKPFWTKNKIYYDDAGNIYRADGKTLLYKTKGAMYQDITTAPEQGLLNVKDVNRRKSALQRLSKKQVTVYSTEPITPEILSAMLGEWGTHLKYSKLKSTALIASLTAAGAYVGLKALVSYIIDKDEEQRRAVGEYMVKNKLSQKDLDNKLKDKQFKQDLDKKLGFK